MSRPSAGSTKRFAEAEGTELETLATEHMKTQEQLEQEKRELIQQVRGKVLPKWTELKIAVDAFAEWKKGRKGRELTEEEAEYARMAVWRIRNLRIGLTMPPAIMQEIFVALNGSLSDGINPRRRRHE